MQTWGYFYDIVYNIKNMVSIYDVFHAVTLTHPHLPVSD